jgi:MtN3 and saliva related transmembrane protein
MNKPWVDAIGWFSTALLLITLLRQVYTEWKSGSTAGLSKWLFIGQVAASVGFTIYSWLLHNWVFMGSNAAILAVAIAGEIMYARNRRSTKRSARTQEKKH